MTIYTFDTTNYLLYPIMKSYFKLNDKEVYKTVQSGFEILQKQLMLKKVSYTDLKGALIPSQDKDKYEICFVVDTSQIDFANCGYYIFEKLIPLLEKDSTYSILSGDYIDIIYRYNTESQQVLYMAMNEVLIKCNESRYRHSSQYYLIYINRLSENQRLKIVEGLQTFPWFVGYADLTHSSKFKTYISYLLKSVCIKNRKRIIMSHPSDYLDNENVNINGLPFEDNGFSILSINDDSYQTFLSYKIESEPPDKDDVSFSLNALFPKFDSLEKIKLHVSEDKWNKYLVDKSKKGRIIEALGYTGKDKERFIREVYKRICANYIYNLRENEFGDLMFNIYVDLPTINNHLRKTAIALKYYPEKGEMEIVTIT